MKSSDDTRGDPEEFVDYMDHLEEWGQKDQTDIKSPTISLHALVGIEGCQTMRVLGKIKRQSLVMLIDFGSTHNFIDQFVAKRLRCHTKTIMRVAVTVANGEVL